MALADGVGGWEQMGVDSGLFSKELIKNIERMQERFPNKTLKQILMDSVKITENVGSSTALIVTLDKKSENKIKATNLGDSGYMILRAKEMITPKDISIVHKS